MIEDTLLDKKYYLSKMSMFLKETYGIDATVDLMLDWIKSVNAVSDYLTNVLDIWNDNYKDDMIEKFGYKYFYRTLDETNTYLRGHLKDANNNEFYISNVSLTDFENINYEIVNGSKDGKTFYAIYKSKDTSFDKTNHYFTYSIDASYELTKSFASPKSLELYEKDGLIYKQSSDNTFDAGKDYFIREDIGNGQYKYTKATPINLNLYEGKIYKVSYIDNNEYNQTSPFALNLVKSFTSVEEEDAFTNKQALDLYGGNRVATPLNANNGNALYELSNGKYVLTTDGKFKADKTYYMDSSGEAASPFKCNLKNPVYAGKTDKFKSEPTWKFLYQGVYKIAQQYNLFLNLYHLGVTYQKSKSIKFIEGTNYYKYSPQDACTSEQVSPINSATTLKDIGLEELYDEDGKASLPFDSTKTYYLDSERKHRLFPVNLKLIEEKIVEGETSYVFTKDTEFGDGKTYYYLKHESPVSLGLYEGTSSEKTKSTATEFDPGTNYYLTIDSYFPVSPSTLNLYEHEVGKILSSSSEGTGFIFETYYTNQTFAYSEMEEEAETFGKDVNLIKEDSEYESQNTIVEEYGDGKDFKSLDIIASIVGCSRLNKIKYEEEGQKKEELIDLSNEDLLDLIKIKIIQNNYTGTLRELVELYKIKLNYKIYISLVQETFGETPSYRSAACNVYLEEVKDINNEIISPNMQKLFLYSDMFIESLGIEYNKTVVPNIDNLLWLDRDYAFKNEMALYDVQYKGEPEKRNTSTRLG